MRNASNAHMVNELSELLDGLEHVFDALGDADARNQFEQTAKLARERSKNTMFELSEQVRKLPDIQRQLTDIAAPVREATN
jgi:ElaB/YqjD/DUF883 family membrane-anchored ribosome-binding protein